MGSNNSDIRSLTRDDISVKVVVLGAFGVGKTTLVSTVSEITPLTTEGLMTEHAVGVDELPGPSEKTTTTVALDFGRRTFSDIVLYLFGAPGQERFAFVVDQLMHGALGAVVLADTRQVEAAFPAIDRCEAAGIPFVVAVNRFDSAPLFPADDLRAAFALRPDTPLLLCDARHLASAVDVLVALVKHLMARRPLTEMEPAS
ncbi:ATP/GTP-binding protein [Phytomonospora sp. NPDC050363]|uniref:GTP-binding protein n=1 Tax=Phytomonospora sp. NPDC050363 TaxID=3155642 RepID=UPI0034075D33